MDFKHDLKEGDIVVYKNYEFQLKYGYFEIDEESLSKFYGWHFVIINKYNDCMGTVYGLEILDGEYKLK